MIYLISRHAGAIEWSRQQGIQVDIVVPHLEGLPVQAGDWVIGTLPVQLAAAVQANGARYLHLTLDVPFAWRGQELTCSQMYQAGARLQEYRITPVAHQANHLDDHLLEAGSQAAG